jgi:putative peptidoglycan binding protein
MRREPPSQIDEGRREDDWFAEEGELDWAHDPRHDDDFPDWPQEERRSTGLTRPPRVQERPPASAAIARRRRMALFGGVALAVLIIVIVVVATSGGGGGGGSPVVATTTSATTTPATTPTTTPTTTATTPTLHVTIPAGGNLSAGDSGSQVETLQKALAQLGLYDGKVDGDFGTGTHDAVVAFQNAHNLTPDGIVGQQTADAINQALASSSG